MNIFEKGIRAAGLLLRLNADRLFTVGMIVVALLAATLVAHQFIQP